MKESRPELFLAALWETLVCRVRKIDRLLVTRLLGHLVVVGLLILAAGFTLPKKVGAAGGNNSLLAAPNDQVQQPFVRFTTVNSTAHFLETSVQPFTSRTLGNVVPLVSTQQSARTEIIVYRAQPGDYIDVIAMKFGLQPTTIMYSNPEIMEYPDSLAIDQEVRIPPVDGAIHTVESGDTIESIAETYQVSVEAITGFAGNHLEAPYTLTIGQELVIPGGTAPAPPEPEPVSEPAPSYQPVQRWTPATGYLDWPTYGMITQDCYSWHVALDIHNQSGTPIYAADSGYVSVMETLAWSYGWYIIIDHGNGIKTRYAHLSGFNVVNGQAVEKGQVIGWMGSTGKSTGPHLHFEVIVNGSQVCPWGYLPG